MNQLVIEASLINDIDRSLFVSSAHMSPTDIQQERQHLQEDVFFLFCIDFETSEEFHTFWGRRL
jgi:hypothetical protein